ncbi:MAG: hypothetical protein ACLFVU_09255 [Phycisphaerae bacterium]
MTGFPIFGMYGMAARAEASSAKATGEADHAKRTVVPRRESCIDISMTQLQRQSPSVALQRTRSKSSICVD